MVKRSSIVRAFALAFTIFILVPPFLGKPLPFYPLMHWADLVDVFTPIVVIPLYWLLFTDGGRIAHPLRVVVAFVVLAAIWAEGQGMHLSANSIGNLMGGGSDDIHRLAHFYDEVLSHYLWHFAILGFAVLLSLSAARASAPDEAVRWVPTLVWGLLYGLTASLASLEGETVPMVLPLSALFVAWLLVRSLDRARSHGVVAFFLCGYVVALIVFIGWGIAWGGFPAPSEVGLI